MALSMRLELNLTHPDGPAPTFGDVKKWVALAEKHGVTDDQELSFELSQHDEVVGTYVWGVPRSNDVQ